MLRRMGMRVAFLDLDKNHLGAIAHHQIDFAARSPPAASDDVTATPQIELLHASFGGHAGQMRQFSTGRPHHSSVSFNAR